MVRENPESEIIWIREYRNDTIRFYPNAICESSDQSLYLTGYMVTESDSSRLFISKFDTSGIPVWSKSYNYSPGTDAGNDILASQDNSLLITGAINQYGTNDNLLILKISPDGEVILSKSYGGSSSDEGNSIIETDSGFISIGFTDSFSDNLDIYFVSTDNKGNCVCQGGDTHPEVNSFELDTIPVTIKVYPEYKVSDNITLKSSLLPDSHNYTGIKRNLFYNEPEYLVYPNPCPGLFHIKPAASDINNATLHIYSTAGSLIFSGKSGTEQIIKINHKGIYLIEITSNDKIYRTKLIVQ